MTQGLFDPGFVSSLVATFTCMAMTRKSVYELDSRAVVFWAHMSRCMWMVNSMYVLRYQFEVLGHMMSK